MYELLNLRSQSVLKRSGANCDRGLRTFFILVNNWDPIGVTAAVIILVQTIFFNIIPVTVLNHKVIFWDFEI